MERERIRIKEAKAKAFFVFCETCDKVLYEASQDNFITRAVADDRIRDHLSFFKNPHRCLLVDFTKRMTN